MFPHITNFRHAVDIGAHCGLWSRVLEKIFPDVTAFEPVHADCLAINAPDVMVYQVALGKENGTARMSWPTGNSGNTAIRPDGDIEVPLRTLDSYGLTEVDFIKIDCEGYEYNVLLGGLETIKTNRPAIILEQHLGWMKNQGLYEFGGVKLLEKLGMKVIAKFNSDYLLTF